MRSISHRRAPRMLRGHRALALLSAAFGLALLPGAASASTATAAESAGHLRIIVPSPAFSQGRVVSVGDWNGDGLPDVAVSDTTGGAAGQGVVWIVYGQSAQTTIDLSGGTLPAGDGVTILGSAAASFFGDSLASGDVNGDGRPDLVIGAPTFLTSSVVSAAWVIFAGAGTGATPLTSGTLDLSSGAGTHGYAISGPAAHGDLDQFGESVAVVKDMNGDGRAEVAVGAPVFTNAGRTSDGAAYVAFGQSGTTTEHASLLSSDDQGFAVFGAAANDQLGSSLDGGDFNGDGLGDLLIGAPRANAGTGAAYVVFGKSGTANLDLADITLTSKYLAIDGSTNGDHAGESVALVPDMNGDGRSEAVVCAPFAAINGLMGAGECAVVFGRAAAGSLSLSTLGTAGFTISGALGGGLLGTSVAAAGDVNGDGRGDIVIGGSNLTAGPDGGVAQVDAGLTVVVLGQPDPLPLSVDNLGAHGYAIAGTALNQFSGYQVAAIGDVDGDGRSDLVVGSDGVGGRFFDEYTARPLPTAGTVMASAAATSGMQVAVPVTVLGGAPTTVSLVLTPIGGAATTVNLGSVATSGTITAPLTGLAPATTYTLQAVVSNVFGATRGAVSSAGTLALSSTVAPPPPTNDPDMTSPAATVTRPSCPHLVESACAARRASRAAWATLKGSASDPGAGASGVHSVRLLLLHSLGNGRCEAYQAGKLRTASCTKARTLWTPAVVDGEAWSLRIALNLPLGTWTLKVRAVDKAGNRQRTPATASFHLTH
jgi:FG-GAP repeat